jgi:hypothetical protein
MNQLVLILIQDDEYAECANDPELEYLFISEWQEFDYYDPYYAYLG